MKFLTSIAAGLGAFSAVSAAPMKRNNGGSTKSDIDVTILQVSRLPGSYLVTRV